MNSFMLEIKNLVTDKDADLAMTKYSKDKNEAQEYQHKQYNSVLSILKKLHQNYGDNVEIDEKYNIIPNEYKETCIEHIGKSASICIDLLKESDEDDNFIKFGLGILNFIVGETRRYLRGEFSKIEDFLQNDSQWRSRLDRYYIDFDIYHKKWEKKLKDTINEINSTVSSTQKLAKKTKNDLINSKKAARDAKKIADNIISTVLTILGIFVAIIIAIVACYLNILLAKHNTDSIVSRPFDFMQLLLMGHITLTIIFFLMYLVCKMTPFNLACHCSQYISRYEKQDGADKQNEIADCSKCKERCSFWNRLFCRYPYICLINISFILAYLCLAVWQFINIYCRNRLDDWVNVHIEMLTFKLIIFVFILFVSFILLILFRQNQKNKK